MDTVPSQPIKGSDVSPDVLQGQVKDLTKQGRDLAKERKFEEAFAKFEAAIQLDNENIIALNSYANALVKANKLDRAIRIFERSLSLDNTHIYTLNGFANALARSRNSERAIELLEMSLQIEPDNAITLSKFANLLAQNGNIERAIELLGMSLQIEPGNVITLSKLANLLAQNGDIERAIELLEMSLQIEPDNAITLNTFANLLTQHGDIERAIKLFEMSLRIEPDNVITLTSFGNLLSQYGEIKRPAQLFKRALKLEPNDIITLNIYANLLAQKGEIEHAIKLFDHALNLDNRDVRTLNSFANLLAQEGEINRAIQLFERLFKIEPTNIITLSHYANLLAQKGESECAIKLFKKGLHLEPDNPFILGSYANLLIRKGDKKMAIKLLLDKLKLDDDEDVITLHHLASLFIQEGETSHAIRFLERAFDLEPNNAIIISSYSYARLQYAKQLEGQRRYEEAVEQLLTIPLSTQRIYHANIIRLHLGRLYYLLNQPEQGKQYIDEAIANSEDKDKSRLYAARSLLAVNSNSDEAIQLLRQIEESSPRYDEAMKALALNADAQTAYELFAGGEEDFGNTEMLYRAMYHKIGNEVAILKSIAQRLLRSVEAKHPIVRDIVGDLEDLQDSISRQRATEKATIAAIPSNNYQQLIEVVSKTAHDIADEVNNILATIESKTRRALRKLSEDSPLKEKFEKLLAQLELTQTALNDLKSINEGMVIRRHRFPVRKLFEKWDPENWSNRPRIQKARITFRLDNPEAEFDGDEEKIKSIINELVENSLKYNHDQCDLLIRMFSQDLLNPLDIGMPTVPGDRKYLYIQISDNGKGIPPDKKEWIFQPLHTTSSEEKGSGLGLFIARKILQKMGGYIRETGEVGKGARFQIYIPYITEEEV
jgi:tetratricopeptide (TPR) repeat protein